MTVHVRMALAVLSGVLYFVGFVGYDQFYLSWICLAPLLVALRDVTPGRAALLGWLMGLVTHMGGYHWVIGLLREFGDLPLPAAFLGYVLLCAGQGAFFAVYALILAVLWRGGAPGGVWLAPVVHAALELVYPFLFPSYLANSQLHFLAFMQIAELVGVIGMGFVMVLVSSVAAESFLAWRGGRPLPRRGWAVAVALLVLSVGYGLVRIPQVEARVAAAPTLKVGVVQANLGARDKRRAPDEWIRRHQERTLALVQREPDLDLVVWPETAYNRLIPNERGSLRGALQVGHGVPMLSGVLRYAWDDPDDEPRIYNAAVAVDGEGVVTGIYNKNLLLAFGEFVPLASTFPALKALFPHTGDFTAGSDAVPVRVGDHTLAVHVCYEDIMPGFVRGLMAERDGERPQVLMNLTNDSWFGDTIQPFIHLALASFRTVEHRRALVRSTNTGISAYVDPVGRIAATVPQYTEGDLVVRVPLMEGTTVYQVVGDLPAWLCVGITGFLLLLAWRRRHPGHAPR